MTEQATQPGAQETVAPEKDDETIWNELEHETLPDDGDEEAGLKADDADDPDDLGESEAGNAPAEPSQQPDDPWAAAPEVLRNDYQSIKAEKERLEHRLRSEEGRIRAAQARLQELSKTSAAPQKDDGPEDISKALEGLKSDYPEIAEPISKVVAAINGRVEELDRAEQSRRMAAQNELQHMVEVQTAELERAHPDWFDTLKNNGSAFATWVEDQPKRIRDAAYRNAQQIVDASEAASVVAAFKDHLGIGAKAPEHQHQPENDRRKRQLAASATPSRSAGKPTVSGIPDDGDPEAIWEAMERAEQAGMRV